MRIQFFKGQIHILLCKVLKVQGSDSIYCKFWCAQYTFYCVSFIIHNIFFSKESSCCWAFCILIFIILRFQRQSIHFWWRALCMIEENTFSFWKNLKNAATGGCLLHDDHWLEFTFPFIKHIFFTHQGALRAADSSGSWLQSTCSQLKRKASLHHKTQNQTPDERAVNMCWVLIKLLKSYFTQTLTNKRTIS